MMEDPNNCPRCDGNQLSWGYSAPPFVTSVCCYSEGCEAVTTDDHKEDAITLWNRGVWHYRITEYDDNGDPCGYEYNV